MKTVNWWWILWGIVTLILALIGVSYAAKSVKKKEQKPIDPNLAAALTAAQSSIVLMASTSNIQSMPPVVSNTNNEFSPNDFSNEFA